MHLGQGGGNELWQGLRTHVARSQCILLQVLRVEAMMAEWATAWYSQYSTFIYKVAIRQGYVISTTGGKPDDRLYAL